MASPLSHLRDHKFKHSFQNTLNPLCICGKTKTLKQNLTNFSTTDISPINDLPF